MLAIFRGIISIRGGSFIREMGMGISRCR